VRDDRRLNALSRGRLRAQRAAAPRLGEAGGWLVPLPAADPGGGRAGPPVGVGEATVGNGKVPSGGVPVG
jgi:hypothetical protein